MEEKEETRYYRFDIGNVIIRRTGDLIEKFGEDKQWTPAPNLRYRFMSGNMSLTEITKEEAEALCEK